MKTVVPTVDALLAVEVGNSRIGLGVWDDDGLHDVKRVDVGTRNAWRDALACAWRRVAAAPRRAVVVASVFPQAAVELCDVIEEVCGLTPLHVRRDIDLPIEMGIDNPGEVGVDRVCAAAAAFDRIRGACVVASFGTAITVDCVSPEGEFLGGAILPGFELSCAALHDGTALLPHVHPERPIGPFGRNTHDAIVNGVVYGGVGALREIVERYATALREWPQLVLTGGNAPLVRELADFVDSVVPDLCLMGVALAYRRAAGLS